MRNVWSTWNESGQSGTITTCDGGAMIAIVDVLDSAVATVVN